jgi:hypothetical protein
MVIPHLNCDAEDLALSVGEERFDSSLRRLALSLSEKGHVDSCVDFRHDVMERLFVSTHRNLESRLNVLYRGLKYNLVRLGERKELADRLNRTPVDVDEPIITFWDVTSDNPLMICEVLVYPTEVASEVVQDDDRSVLEDRNVMERLTDYRRILCE